MFLELDRYWQELSEARITRSIHEKWEERRLPSFMRDRYTHTVMHRVALGRGPLRAVIHRRHDEKLQYCRYGCDAKEDAMHVVMHCTATKRNRETIQHRCFRMKLDFTMKTIFREIQLQDDLEDLLSVFLNT